jgi:pimeloyl-ACP methyl ester carboxylesterase
MSGFCVDPRPKVLVSFWGYGDITSEWYSRPSPFYNRRPAVSKAEALRAVGDEVIAEPRAGNNRRLFYLYCRQQGLWPREVGGRDPITDPGWFDRYCPQRNVSSEYPPTMLVHGQEDTDVPHEQSVQMAKELSRAGVKHELISIPDVGHGLSGAGTALLAETYERAAEFAKQHI